jgi:hypothetical protein
MVTSILIAEGGPVPDHDRIYRALNPKHENGLPSDNHFVMSRKQDPPGDGISTGIASRISLSELRSIESIQYRYGKCFCIAELIVGEVLSPVAILGVSVLQKDAPDWGGFSYAHAVITGYQSLEGTEGKRRIHEFRRHLVNLARKRYYAPGSETAVSVD